MQGAILAEITASEVGLARRGRPTGMFKFPRVPDSENQEFTGDWSSSLCGAMCAQPAVCMQTGCWCFSCVPFMYYGWIGKLVSRLNEDEEVTACNEACCMALVLDLQIGSGGLLLLLARQGIVARYQIKESWIDSLRISCFCPCLAVPQMVGEMMAHFDSPGGICTDPDPPMPQALGAAPRTNSSNDEVMNAGVVASTNAEVPVGTAVGVPPPVMHEEPMMMDGGGRDGRPPMGYQS